MTTGGAGENRHPCQARQESDPSGRTLAAPTPGVWPAILPDRAHSAGFSQVPEKAKYLSFNEIARFVFRKYFWWDPEQGDLAGLGGEGPIGVVEKEGLRQPR